MAVRPAKAQISLCIRPFSSESSLCAQRVAMDPSFLHADSEDSDPPRLSLRCAHMPFCWFCHEAAQITEYEVKYEYLSNALHHFDAMTTKQKRAIVCMSKTVVQLIFTDCAQNNMVSGLNACQHLRFLGFVFSFFFKISGSLCTGRSSDTSVSRRLWHYTEMSHVMGLWYFSSSVNSFFKRAAIQWG